MPIEIITEEQKQSLPGGIRVLRHQTGGMFKRRTKVTPSTGLSWYLKWAGTICILTGAACTSLELFPLNLILSTSGGVFWFVVGIIWLDRSLMLLNFCVGLIYFAGLLRYYLN